MGNQECRMCDGTGAKPCRKCGYTGSGCDWCKYTGRSDSPCGRCGGRGTTNEDAPRKVVRQESSSICTII